MLQKLLIASFAAFMLSACSGSDSSSSETVNEPPPAPSPDNPEPEPEPVGPEVLASITFGTEASVDSWQARCADGGNCGADLSHNAEEGVLVVNPAWVTASDNLEVYTALDPEIADLAFATVEVDVRVTEEYITDGNLRLQVFFENAAGGVAYTGWTTPETEYENEDGEMVSTNGWTQLEFDTIQMSSFSYTSDAFTLQNINAMGVQFVSNGKPVDVGGNLWIDNVRILAPSDADKPKTSISAPLTEGWRLNNDPNGTLEYTDAGVVWAPGDAEAQLMWDLSGPQNLDGATYTFELVADEAFVAGGGTVQPIAQRTDDYSIGYYNCTIPAGDFVAGETLVVECGPLPGDFDLTADMAVQIGLIAKEAAAGTITVTDMTVDLADGVTVIEPPTTTNVINIPVDSGWYVNGDAVPMSFTDEGAQYSPTAADQQFVYDLAGPVDLGGASVEIEFTVDETFIASGANLQPFAQQIAGDGGLANWGCWINNGDLVAGENTYTCPMPDEFDLVDEESVVKIGFQPKGDNVAGTIVVTDMTITLAEGITVPADQYGEAPAPEPTEIEPELTADNFQIFDGTETVTVSEAGVSFEPATVDAKLAYVLEGPFDLGGQSFTITYTVDQAYIDAGNDLQPFAQNNYTGYAYFGGCYISNGSLVADTPTEYVCENIADTIVAGEDQSIRVGLQVKGTGGTVTINELVIPIP